MTDHRPFQSGERESEPLTGAQEETAGASELVVAVPEELRHVSFRVSARGYDRESVDAYVRRVNRLIAEFDAGSSPEAAVRGALDRVGEQTGEILQRAREAAETITATARQEMAQKTAHARAAAERIVAAARAEAEEIVNNARAEAEETLVRARAEANERLQRSEEENALLQEQADALMRQLRSDAETISRHHDRLRQEIRATAERLEGLARWASAMGSPTGLQLQDHAMLEDEPRDKAV